MTSNELRELVKSHFNLVEASAEVTATEIEETFSEETTEEVTEVVEESFGEIADENKAFTLRFPGDELEVGDKVTVVTTEGQEMAAPDGEHRLADGIVIVTKDSVVESIEKAVAETTEETLEEEAAEIVSEEMAEEKEEEMMEPAAKVEEIVEAIVSEVKDEMKKMEEKMAALEDKVSKMEAMPAAEPTITSTGKKMKAEAKRGFSAFNVETSRNADRIKAAMEELKNRKK